MKIKRFIKSLAAAVLLAATIPSGSFAQEPYITWTQGPGGYVVDTQTAYSAEEVLNYSLSTPEDFYIADDQTMYICDTGNSRIVTVSPDGSVGEYTDENLNAPTGIHVADGHIYIADRGAQKVWIYSMDFQLERYIEKPTEAIFGANTNFVPVKLITDARGNLYVVSEGSTAGLMQFNPQGDFLGYFGSNSTNNTFKMILQRTFFTEEQLNKLFKNTPPSVTNVGIDSQGLIYTVTSGESITEPIKKLSISGLNLFDDMVVAGSYVDVDVDGDGNTFSVTTEGTIYEYDSNGNLLFAFGGRDSDRERVGILREPAAIEVTDDGQLYVLDRGMGCIVHYEATEFARTVHEGIAMYNDGLYAESQETWEEIRKMNSSFVMAYEALAQADYKNQNYASALSNYRIAENKEGYSQTYWVYRNEWLQNNLGLTVVIIIALCIVWGVIRAIDRRKHILDPVRRVKKKILNVRLISQICFVGKMMKKPSDAYYEMKFKGRASIASATVLYIWLIILQFTDIYVVSYLFNTSNPWRISLFSEIMWVVAPVFLFIACNYLVSTITEGEGKVRDLYCGTIYALTPYLVFALPLQILTHALTLNEGFIYQFAMFAVIAWCVVLFVMMIKEIHDYSLSKTFKNLAVTAFTIALFLLAGFILWLLYGQLRDFIISLIQEVAARG